MMTPGSVLLHDTLDASGRSLYFAAPRGVLVAHEAAEAREALTRLEAAGAEGLWAAGYLAYELGYLFEERLAHLLPERSRTPLLWMGLYEAPQRLTRAEADAALADAPDGRAVEIVPGLDFAAYERAFDRVKTYIADGDTYQVNLTFKARFRLEGDAVGLYRDLAKKQPTAYGALIHAGDHMVLSRSPELFVSNHEGVLSARPMKGTLKRGRTLAEDEAGRKALAADEKNRAENLMIVDLLRNDLGRIAEIGSVRVSDLFTVETYRTLHTMTSGITARMQPGTSLGTVLANLFPCGSITGAPKLRAMEIIDEVEAGPRGLYTGAIGFIAPHGDFTFNVAIRTAVIDKKGDGEIGIGGGIVADSRARDEYDEALLKMQFFTDPPRPIALIETILWTRSEGFSLLARHLDRMAESARYFGLDFDRDAAEAVLDAAAQDFGDTPMRVRLLFEEGKDASVTATVLPPNPTEFKVMIAPERVESQNPLLAHKTTNRTFLDEPRIRAHEAEGVDEVIFVNEHGELTEGSITSLFIARDGMLLTPPLSAGLLPGTLRAELIAAGKAREQRLYPADLDGARIFLGNSVRGLIPGRLIKP